MCLINSQLFMSCNGLQMTLTKGIEFMVLCSWGIVRVELR